MLRDKQGQGRGDEQVEGQKSIGSKGEPPHPHQVAASMFGLEHLGHLSEVAPEVLLIGCAREGHSNDPLCDVHQVQLTAVLHGPAHTHVSRKTVGKEGPNQNLAPRMNLRDLYIPTHKV
jgi:hypothetical protein